MSNHLVIPDTQCKDGIDFEYLKHIGQYIVDVKPDVIIHLGDFADMESLSSYDQGKKSFEGRRYTKDIAAAHKAMDTLLGPLHEFNFKAKDPITQETIYELIYVEVVDDLEKNGKSISSTVQLSDTIQSKVLVSYDAIKIDSDIPLVSDSDHQRVFPNSIKNMRSRIKTVGANDREFLPLWMRSIQDQASYETGYVKALPLCYCKPGSSDIVMARIKASNFDFKTIDFEADRYIIDILGGVIEDKYLAFPQRGEKLP